LFGVPLCIVAHAQITAPKYSNEFLAIGVGARGQGMAGTQTALAEDATAGYWNPATVQNITDKYNVSLMHTAWFGGIANYDFIGFATKIDSLSALGVSLIRFGIDDIPDTRYLYDANGALNYDNIRFFSAADYAVLITYARELPAIEGLTVGGNFKIIHRRAGEFATAWGFGLDAAAFWKKDKWKIGAVAKDVSGTFNAWTHTSSMLEEVYAQTGNTIPQNSIEATLPQLWLGVSRNLFDLPVWSLLLALDMRTTFDGARNVLLHTSAFSINPSMGFEVGYKEIVFLRGGVGQYQKGTDITGKTQHLVQPDFGLGISYDRFRLDYALTNAVQYSASLYSHIVSLSINLGDKPKDARDE